MRSCFIEIFTVICLFSSTAAFAKKTLLLTLPDVIFLTLRNNPEVRQADIQRIADKYALVLAKNQFEPKFTFTTGVAASYTKADGINSSSRNVTISPGATLENHYGTQFNLSMTNPLNNPGQYNPSVLFSVTQPLIKGFGKAVVDAALENAMDTERTNKLQFRQLAMDTLVRTIADYFSLVSSVQSLVISNQSLDQNKQTIKNDKILIKAGRMAGADIIQAKAQVATTLSTIESNKNAIKSAKATLLDDLGLNVNTVIAVPATFNFNKTVQLLLGSGAPIPTIKQSEILALSQNTAYQVAKIGIYSLQRGLVTAVNSSEWDLELTASTTRGGGPNGDFKSLVNNRNYNNTVGLNLTIPIDDVNNKSAVIAAKVGLDKAKIALAESKRGLINSTKTQYQNLETSEVQVKLSRTALSLQQQTYVVSKKKFIAGKISNFELLTTQQTLNTAENTLLGSEIAYLNAIETFENQIGMALKPWHVRVRY